MRKLSFYRNHFDFEEWISWYGNFIQRLIEAKKVVRTKLEKAVLVEGLMLKVAVMWENLVEDDIIISLNRDSSLYAKSLGLRLRKHLTRDECEAMLIGHGYLDFKSVGDVKKFAKRYLVSNYNPFIIIGGKEAKLIDEFFIIRNYIAHYSSYAFRSYEKMMEKKYSYKRVPFPGDFLITINRISGNYRWGEYLLIFLYCSNQMKRSVDIKIPS